MRVNKGVQVYMGFVLPAPMHLCGVWEPQPRCDTTSQKNYHEVFRPMFFSVPSKYTTLKCANPSTHLNFGTLLLFFHHKSESVKLHKLTEQMWN